MPQLIALALVGGVAWYAWRTLQREMARVGDEVNKAEKTVKKDQPMTLEKGEDGVYRPKNGD